MFCAAQRRGWRLKHIVQSLFSVRQGNNCRICYNQRSLHLPTERVGARSHDTEVFHLLCLKELEGQFFLLHSSHCCTGCLSRMRELGARSVRQRQELFKRAHAIASAVMQRFILCLLSMCCIQRVTSLPSELVQVLPALRSTPQNRNRIGGCDSASSISLHSGVRDIETFISCVKQSTNIQPDCPFHVLHYVHGMRNAFPIDSLHCLDLGLMKYNLRDLRNFIRRKVALSCFFISHSLTFAGIDHLARAV